MKGCEHPLPVRAKGTCRCRSVQFRSRANFQGGEVGMRLIDADATIKYLREFRCKDCDRRKGMKNGKVRFCYEIGDAPCRACDIGDTIDYFLDEDISPTIDAVPVKGQEAVEPRTEPSAKGYWYTCGACGWWLFEVRDSVHFDDRKRIRFCASCGRPVKWE